MPIFDQGYQHWHGRLAGPSTRWLPITRHGVVVGLRNKWLRAVIFGAIWPPILLVIFLALWGLFEQKSTFLAPLLFLIQDLPEEIKAGPRAYRTAVWTVAFRQFFDIQLIFPMILVLLVGPDLISQDLRFNAIPLYLSRPVRRLEYFLGKLGVIATFLASVTVVPVFVGFLLGIGFSLDPSVIRDTARVLAASLAFSAIVVASAGLLMLAFSSLSKNSRYVAAMWLGFWLVSSVTAGVLENTVGAEWCPLASYTNNINRIRDALLDAGPAWDRLASLGEMGRREVRSPMGMGPFGPGRRTRAGEDSSTRSGPEASASVPRRRSRSSWAPADYPWQWSACVLAGLAAASVLVLATRVRGLDRLR